MKALDAETPPFVDLVTERSVLGAALLYEGYFEKFAREGLRDRHFFRHAHRLIWRRLVEAVQAEGVRDQWPLLTVRMLLIKHGEFDEVGPVYFGNLDQGVPRLGDEGIRVLARRLVECAVGRESVELLERMRGRLIDHPAALTEGFFSTLKASVDALSSQLQGRRIPDHLEHISEVMSAVRAKLKSGPPSFIDTPYPSLNSMLGGGFEPGELVYLGARPGLGKTAMALEIGRRAAARAKTVVAFSREMRTLAIGMRMLSQAGPLNATVLRRRDLSPQHWATIEQTIEQLEALPFFLTHAQLDVDEIRRIVGILADEGPLGLVVVDYLQLIDALAGIKERRQQVEAVSKGLKAITLEHNVPVLCLSSLSRPEDGKAPTLKALRESGNLEHDADTVLLLHREHELQPETEVIVPKARNGRQGMCKLFFRGEFLRFEEQL